MCIRDRHGDGRLRGEFIPFLLGDKVYSLLKEVKEIWDSPHICNMGKIVDTPPMDANVRYEQWDLGIDTYFDYSRQKGWLCAIEQCKDVYKRQALIYGLTSILYWIYYLKYSKSI